MSGIASEKRRMPGRCATFATCWSAGSSGAGGPTLYTRPGTFMRPSRGSAQRSPSIRLSFTPPPPLDVEHRLRDPPRALALEPRRVPGDRLHVHALRVPRRIVPRERDHRLGAVLAGAEDLELARDQALGREAEEELAQERDRGAREAGAARDREPLLPLRRRG